MHELHAEHARELLLAHRPFDALERQHLVKAMELVNGNGAVERRDHFVPGHLTASGFVLSPDRNRVLLIEHTRLGRWLQPGGHIEESDTSFEGAARREIFEETGLEELGCDPGMPGLFDLDVHLIPAHSAEPEHVHYDLRYVFIARHETVVAGEGVRSARFWPMEGIESRFDLPSLFRPVLKIRRITSGLYARGAIE
jgi:8-oxo-dGTP pyrophosphatase MutT (NUDIX family)